MTQSSSIVLLVIVVVFTILCSQNGVNAFSLKSKLKTLTQQQKEASSEVASPLTSSSSSSSISAEQEKKERIRLEFLNQEKLKALAHASKQAQESVSLLQSWHNERILNDQAMWGSLTADDIRMGFKLKKDTPVVMPQKWQLFDAGIYAQSIPSNNILSELEVESKVNVIERVNAFLKGTMCWKSTTQRGIGTIPNSCTDPTHPSFDAGLCYKACASDEHGVATMCIKNACQSGYTNYGLTCTYTAGPLLVGKGCCCTVFGCCNTNCGYGYVDDGGCVCRAVTYGIETDRGVGLIPTGCPTGQSNQAGLCYNQCPSGSVGLATTCWAQCSGSTPVDCGAACASDTGSCVSGIVDMVTGPLTIVLNVVTGGELGAAVKGVKTAAMSAVKDGVSAMVSAAAKRIAEMTAQNLSADGVKATIVNMAQQAGTKLADSSVTNIFTAAQQVAQGQPMSAVDTLLNTVAAADPTGIAATVMAFAKPMC